MNSICSLLVESHERAIFIHSIRLSVRLISAFCPKTKQCVLFGARFVLNATLYDTLACFDSFRFKLIYIHVSIAKLPLVRVSPERVSNQI